MRWPRTACVPLGDEPVAPPARTGEAQGTPDHRSRVVRSAWARHLFADLAAFTLTILSVAPIHAQEDPRRVQIRGFLRAEGEYNDNFFLTEKNKRDDFREILTPGLSLRLSTGRSQAEISYAPSLIHSSVNDQDVQVFHLLDANGSLALAERFTLKAGDHFLRSDEPAITDPRGIRRDRTILIQNTLSSDLTYKQDTWSLTPRYALTLNRTERENKTGGVSGGNPTAGRNQERSLVHALGADGTLDILDRNTLGAGYELTVGEFEVANDFVGHLGRFSFSRQLNPLTTASLGGSVAHRDVRGGSDFNIFRGDAGLRRDVSPLYAVEARVGYGVFDVSGGKSIGEVEYSLTGTYTGRVVRISVTSGQSFQETFLEQNNVGVTRTREHKLEVRYEPTDRVALSLRARVADNRFLQPTTFTTLGQQQERKDLLIDIGPELGFRLTRLLSLTMGYTYTRVDSNLRGFDYENNRVRLGLTATFE